MQKYIYETTTYSLKPYPPLIKLEIEWYIENCWAKQDDNNRNSQQLLQLPTAKSTNLVNKTKYHPLCGVELFIIINALSEKEPIIFFSFWLIETIIILFFCFLSNCQKHAIFILSGKLIDIFIIGQTQNHSFSRKRYFRIKRLIN